MTVISSDDAGWSIGRRRERAARDAESTEFVESAAPRLRRTAYLMCRDWHLAQDLTEITLAKCTPLGPDLAHHESDGVQPARTHECGHRPAETAQ